MNIQQTKRVHILLGFFSFFVPLFFYSCQDFLDVQPDNRATINSADKVRQLLTGAYSNADYYEFAEVLSDNVEDRGMGIGSTQRSTISDAWNYAAKYSLGLQQGTVLNYWRGAYHAIAQANQALEYISSLPEKEQGAYDQYKGEAFAIRAYYHFMLVNFFGKHYDPNTAGSDLGIPYVVEVEKTLLKQYKRNTVQEVYDYVWYDLERALQLITDDKFYAKPKFHFNTKAVRAFAVRFFLFKQDWKNVVKYANEVFPDESRISSFLKNYKLEAYKNKGAIEQSLWYGSGDNANPIGDNPSVLLVADGISDWAELCAAGRYGITYYSFDQFFAEFFGYGLGLNIYRYYGQNPNLRQLKFHSSDEIVNVDIAESSAYAHINMPLFSTEEVLLSRAEALVMLGDSIHAMKDLNILRQARNEAGEATRISAIDSIYSDYITTPLKPANGELPIDEYERSIIFKPMYALPQDKRLMNL